MNLIKYGPIWVSAGITISGALWFIRGNGVSGEDLAEATAAVTERPLAQYTGTNDYTFTSNVVQSGVAWSPLYDTVLCGARTLALTAVASNAWWVAGDGPEDAQDATLTTDAPAPWTSLDTRITNSVTLFFGLSAVNFPITSYLWSRLNTNALTTAFTPAAAPWASGNWWTGIGIGTNVYRYSCEKAVAGTVSTNYSYTLSAHSGSIIPTYTNKFQVGAVYSYTGDTTIAPYSAKVFTPDAPAGGFVLYALTVGGTKLWALGPNVFSYWKCFSPAYPAIGNLEYSGDVLEFTQNMSVTTNYPVYTNKAVTTNNLNEARCVMTNMNRTVWFGWDPAEITATNVIRYSDYTAFTSDPATWPQEDPWDYTPETYYTLYAAGLTSWQTVDSTNAATEVGITLAERPSSPYADFWNTGYLGQPAGMHAYDVSYLYVYSGCRTPLYPSDYAFKSNYVSRFRVYVVVKDEFSEKAKRWYKVCDAAAPSARPYFSLGNVALTPSAEQWYPFILTLADFSIYGDGGWMESHPNYSLEGLAGGDLQLGGYAVVVDWNWRHFGTSPFVPSNNVPAWASP